VVDSHDLTDSTVPADAKPDDGGDGVSDFVVTTWTDKVESLQRDNAALRSELATAKADLEFAEKLNKQLSDQQGDWMATLAARNRTIEVLWACLDHALRGSVCMDHDSSEAINARNADALAEALGIKEGS
jgi:FtsZ-binding cell division protein ZapB